MLSTNYKKIYITDLKTKPALIASLFLALGIVLGSIIPLPFSTPTILVLLLLLTSFTLKPTIQLLSMVLIGLALCSNALLLQKVETDREDPFTITFHTAPLYKNFEGYTQKVRLNNTGRIIITTLEKPLLPGTMLQVIAAIKQDSLHINKITNSHHNKTIGWIYKKFLSHIDAMPGNAKSFYYASLLRERYKVDSTIREIFEHSGLIHLMAISGLHIALFGVLFAGLLRVLPCPYHWLPIGAALCCTLLLYIIGPSSSTIRALLMFWGFALSPILKRRHNLWNSLGGAAFLILLHDPLQLFSPCFQLSFTATAAVLLSLPFAQKGKWKFTKGTRFYLLSSILIGIMTAPILLWHFQELSLFAPLFNMAFLFLLTSTFSLQVFALFIGLLHFPSGAFISRYVSFFEETILFFIQETIFSFNLYENQLLISHTLIGIMSLLLIYIVLLIYKRAHFWHGYVLALLSCVPLFFRSNNSISHIKEIHPQIAIVYWDKNQRGKALRKKLQKTKLNSIEVLHVISKEKKSWQIAKELQAYLPQKRVIHTQILSSLHEKSPITYHWSDTVTVGDLRYIARLNDDNCIAINILRQKDNHCHQAFFTLPLKYQNF